MVMDEPPMAYDNIDAILNLAQRAGISATHLEIRPPRSDDRAWTVTEIDRRWPTQVDAVAIDPHTMTVVDHTQFAHFPLMAKLTRWGVDFHMGVLFGLPNQLLLIVFGVALCAAIVMGYRLWWIKRPAQSPINPLLTLSHSWRALSLPARLTTLAMAIACGVALPVMGASLALFILFDVLRWRAAANVSLAESSVK